MQPEAQGDACMVVLMRMRSVLLDSWRTLTFMHACVYAYPLRDQVSQAHQGLGLRANRPEVDLFILATSD